MKYSSRQISDNNSAIASVDFKIFTKPQSSYSVGGIAKRLTDIVLAGFGLVALAPLMIGLALIVASTSSGPVLFGHTRIGYGGRKFKCWKYRSMVSNGDAVLKQYLAENPEAKAEWEESQKLKRDPRVTAVGRVLRKLSLDELPQLLNILKGEMSVVGPRPIVTEEMDRYGKAIDDYLSMKPGLTGLWQISGRSNTGYKERVALDVDYAKNWSLARDFVIICRTIPSVLASRGSY